MRQAIVAGAGFGEGQTPDRHQLLGDLGGTAVLQLEAHGDLALGIVRPDIGDAAIFRAADAPDMSREALAAGAAATFDGKFRHARPGPFVAPARDGDLARFRRFHLADQAAMGTRRQRLVDLPDIGAHRRPVEAPGRQRHEHHRRAVAGRRRPAIDQALHEVAQAIEAEGVVLHLVIDGVAEGLRHALALFIGIRRTGRAELRIGDDLVVFPQLDRLVDAARLVVGIDGGNHRQGAGPVGAEAVALAGGADIIRAVQHGLAGRMRHAGGITARAGRTRRGTAAALGCGVGRRDDDTGADHAEALQEIALFDFLDIHGVPPCSVFLAKAKCAPPRRAGQPKMRLLDYRAPWRRSGAYCAAAPRARKCASMATAASFTAASSRPRTTSCTPVPPSSV